MGTCPIGLITSYAETIADALGLESGKQVVLGLALGHPDPDAAVNRFRSARVDLPDILHWYE